MHNVTVGILVFEGCQESGLTAPLDAFRIVDALSAAGLSPEPVAFEARFVSIGGGPRRTAGDMRIQTDPAGAAGLHAVIIPGVHHRDVADLLRALTSLDAEAEWLARVAATDTPVLASCSAVFLLGAAGVLDGRRATTSWWLGPALHERFPKVRLEADGRIVADGACVSAAGVTSYHDLALWLVQRFAGDEMQRACAKFLLLDLDRQTQTPFVIDRLMETPREDLLAKARDWLNERLAQTVRIEDLARHCGVSQRTLLRRFRDTVDRTPARYLQTLRLARAKALLEDTALPAAEVAVQCGYADVATFRKTFKTRIRLTPQQYRDRFQRVRRTEPLVGLDDQQVPAPSPAGAGGDQGHG